MKAVLVVSHGSRFKKTETEVASLVSLLSERLGNDVLVKYAFLEIQQPSIPDGIEQCVLAGAHEICVLLNFLNAGRHVDFDIPAFIKEAKQSYPHIVFKLSFPLGQHPRIVDLFVDGVHEAKELV